MAQSTPVNPTIFVQIPLHNIMVQEVTRASFAWMLHTNRSSFNQWKKRVAWDDVANKAFPLPQSSNFTNLLPTCSINLSIGILNM